MQWEFRQGERVELLSSAGTPTLKFASGQYGTVLRCAPRDGKPRYLVRIDQSDAFYGLYWVGGECLQRMKHRVA